MSVDGFQHILSIQSCLLLLLYCGFFDIEIDPLCFLIGPSNSSESTCSFFTLPISFSLSELCIGRIGVCNIIHVCVGLCVLLPFSGVSASPVL